MNKKKLVTMTAAVALVGAMGVGATLALLTDKTDTLVNSFSVATGYSNEENQGIKIQEKLLKVKDAPADPDSYGEKTYYGETVSDGDTTTTFTGNAYTDLIPGDTVTKDPNAVLLSESIESYIFMKVEGIDKLEKYDIDGDGNALDFIVETLSGESYVDGLNTDNWTKVANIDKTNTDLDKTLDGYYVYHETVNGVKVYTFDPTNGEDFVTKNLFDAVYYSSESTYDGTTANIPTISLTAYAVQAQNVEDYSTAFSYIPSDSATPD